MSRNSVWSLLRRWGFSAFLITQFLGALNDNIYQMVIQLLAARWTHTQEEASKYVSLALAVFVLPFLLFSGYAGYLADVKSKRKVLVVTKSLEIVAMLLALLAFFSGSIPIMLGVLFLMATQSTFFSPAKYGILPEMLPERDLSRANGLLEMTTFTAIVMGASVGGYLMKHWSGQLAWIGLFLVAVAAVGTATSLGITRVPASGSHKRFSIFPFGEIGLGLRQIYRDYQLRMVVIGICYFYFLGALTKTEIVILGTKVMHLSDAQASMMYTWLAVGIGLGSLWAARLSGDKVEIGLVPLGSLGMGLSAALLSTSYHSYLATCLCFTGLGLSGGLFIVPLNAFLQQRPGAQEKGRILATHNFATTVAMLVAAGVVYICGSIIHVSADRLFLYLGFVTWAGTAYALWLLPDYFVRFVILFFTHILYKIRIEGQEHIPQRGPALVVCNHVSHVDALIVSGCMPHFVRFMIYTVFYNIRALRWLFRLMRAIPVTGDNPKAAVRALRAARAEVEAGQVVCIFAEGGITRTGNLLPFKKGMERIVSGLDVPIVPMHLDRLWGSVFSFKEGKFWWKWPERFPYPVTVTFGAPLPSSTPSQDVRQVIMELGSDAAQHRLASHETLPLRFARTARRRGRHPAVFQGDGRSAGYRQLWRQARRLSPRLRASGEETAALALAFPLGIDAVVANLAAQWAGRVTLNLDPRADTAAWRERMVHAACGALLAPRALLQGRSDLDGLRLLCWEELAEHPQPPFLSPGLSRSARAAPRQAESHNAAAIVDAHGRDGWRRGVLLSHRNILFALEGLAQVLWTTPEERLLTTLPFWQAVGLSGSLWFPLIAGVSVVLIANPEEPGAVEAAARRFAPTLVLATPAQYRRFTDQVAPDAMAGVRHFISAGTTRLPAPTVEAFRARFGRGILASYGLSEMAPLVSINVPDVEDGAVRQTGTQPGSVGHPIPGVAVRIVDEAGRRLPAAPPGRLWVKGPNLFMDYVNDHARAAAMRRDGWLDTGDRAFLDDDGFLHLVD